MKLKIKKDEILVTLTVLSAIVYIIWRIFFTIPFGYGTFAVIWGILLLIIEVLGMIEAIVHFKNMANVGYPERPVIKEEQFPHIDVFIATYNEPIDLLYKTVNGCLNMKYPDKDKVHIYLCDDSARKEVKELANKMKINYLTREDRSHAKAGNLNNALKHSSSPLIVTFDADMIPMSDFLLSTVPYFFLEEKIGFIQIPQSFYNLDLFQFNLFSEKRIPNEQDYFYRYIQVAKNRNNSVIYGGSNTVILREALNEVGGFYTKVITEDFATGLLIQSKGYKCYAIDEIHASGLSPNDLKSLIKQRERWARGCLQTGRKLNILFRKGLSINQKLSYITSIIYWYSGFRRLIYIISPILFGIFGVMIIKCNLFEMLIFWLPMYVFTNISLSKLSNNIRNIKWTNIYETILFPSLLLSTTLETLGISKKKFSVTRKDKVEDDKRYNFKLVIPHIVFAIVTFLSLVNCIIEMFKSNSISTAVVVFWLSINLYYLVMSIFFIIGRKMSRVCVRADIEKECEIFFEEERIRCITKDISETGIAVILDKPNYIPYDLDIKIIINNYKEKIEFTVRVVHVEEFDDKWKYAFVIRKIDENNYKKLLELIYNREPSLPKVIEPDSSVYDDIRFNVLNRCKGKINSSRKLARIMVNKTILSDENIWINIINCNYKYILIKNEEGISKSISIRILKDIVLKCSFEKNIDYKGNNLMLYKIDNYKDVNKNNKLLEVFMLWNKQYENRKINNKENNEKYYEFNEYDYL